MKTPTAHSAIFTAIVLSLCACRERPAPPDTPSSDKTDPSAVSSPVEEVSPVPAAGIGNPLIELNKEIQTKQQTIADLEAAVLMERAKLSENPDYDQPFLLEVLEEQEQNLMEIKAARNRIKELSNPAE